MGLVELLNQYISNQNTHKDGIKKYAGRKTPPDQSNLKNKKPQDLLRFISREDRIRTCDPGA